MTNGFKEEIIDFLKEKIVQFEGQYIDDIDRVIKNNKSEVFTFFMLYYGVGALMSELDCVSEIWNDRTEITPEFIERFIDELSQC